ncbi:MAG: ankyrin repeat domain-containing protein, partial [Nitrospira sp.]|nr:ankyrin repeat domain-containing protein [Nitrospira sp.]
MIRTLRADNEALYRIATETTVNYRTRLTELDGVNVELAKMRAEHLALGARVTRMISGVVEGIGKDGAYSRLVASMSAEELESVVPRRVVAAGEAEGGVGAILTAIGCGSEEGVVWGVKRYSVDVLGVKVKGLYGRGVNLVGYAIERACVRGVVVGVLCELVEGGARSVVGGGGSTPLHWAAGRGLVGSCRMLVGLGVDVNAKTSSGSTALHWAAFKGQAGLCEVLVGLGADVGVVDDDGRTAADVARQRGHAVLSERLGRFVVWGRGVDVVDEGRLDEIAREVVGDGVCGYGAAFVGVGIEGGSGALVRRGVGGGGVDLNGEVWRGMRSISYA